MVSPKSSVEVTEPIVSVAGVSISLSLISFVSLFSGPLNLPDKILVKLLIISLYSSLPSLPVFVISST